MAKGYSKDLRVRAVALVEDGESRREAARVLGVGAATAEMAILIVAVFPSRLSRYRPQSLAARGASPMAA